MKKNTLAFVSLLALGSAQAQQPLPPLAALNRATFDVRGWAADTRGGQGGRLIKVTNLNAAGPGSYREAIEAEGRAGSIESAGQLGGQCK